MKAHRGFTLIEVITVTVVIAILASITTVVSSRQQVTARDTSRSSKATILASALESYYESHGEYPSPRALVNTYSENTGDSVSTLLKIKDKTALVMPKADTSITNSITATLGSDDVIAYEASSGDGNANCQANPAGGCDEFTLTYTKESDGSVVTIESQNKERPSYYETPLQAPPQPTITAVQTGTNLVATAAVFTCPDHDGMTPRYSFRSQVAAGAWSSWGAWQTGNTYTRGSNTNATNYSFQVQVRCESTASVGDTSPASDSVSVTYYAPPAAPGVPAVATSPAEGTVATSATGTAAAVTCNYGSPQYLIDARTNDGAWSAGSWGTSLARTVSANQGVKYGFRATARCVNGTQTTTGGVSAEAIVTTGVQAPGAPAVSGSGPTWSWTPSACPAGSSPYYHYQFSYWDGSGWLPGSSWTWINGTSVTNPAATSPGIQYGINVTQYCWSGNVNSGWSAAANGGTFWVPVVHPKIQYAAIKLATNGSGYWPVIEVKTFVADSANTNGVTAAGGACPSGTAREVLLRGNYDETTNNWQNDVNGWFNADAANTQRTFWNESLASGHYFELTGYVRCRNTSTSYTYDGYKSETYRFVYDIGNLYNVGNTKYNISCQPTNSGDSYCSGGYNSSGTLTDSSIDVCRVFSNGIGTASQQYTDRIALGSTTKNYCW